MRAASYDAGGVIGVGEVETPEPGRGQVRVRIAVSGVNPTDWKARAAAPAFPFQVPGQDGAGVIDAVGDGVDPARVGQRVWTWLAAAGRRWGTAADWSVVPGRQAVPLPDGASFELGASLGVPAMTAHRCLFADGPVTGKTVLVAGGAGAVGHFAIQLAHHAGARVITTVSGPEKAELARQAGAEHVVNYRDPDAAGQIKAIAERVDRVVEVALGANLALAGPGTVIVTYAAEPADPVLPVRACMTANVVLRFILLYGVPADALDQAVADVSAALAAGALTELPSQRFPLPDIAAAHEAAEAAPVGKVFVIPG